MANDGVAAILEQWRRERPDLDPTAMGILGRLARLAKLTERRLETNFKRYDLQGSTFDLLATLRRHGEPFTLNPTQLQQEMMLSSGATTHRIDLLERRGLVERRPDPNDRRGTLIKLTPAGKTLVDEVVVSHLETENELLAGLTDKEKRELAELLGGWAERLAL